MRERSIVHNTQGATLADVLDKILDKGVVVAGDITIALADVDLLKIKIRLLIASVDKAKEMGINWWETDPYLSTKAKELEAENLRLRSELEKRKALPDTIEQRDRSS